MCRNRREKRQSWSSLLSHINAQHYSYMNRASFEEALSSPKADLKLTSKAVWLNNWMELISVRLNPFSIVEDELMRRCMN